MFKEVVEKFLRACQEDNVLKEFASRRSMGLRFIITDRELEFLLAFQDGGIVTSLGAPSDKADMIVRMDVETFDGVMTGRIIGAAAYMTGKLKFTGDTSKGMLLQRLIKDMVRLYTRSRSEVADPLS